MTVQPELRRDYALPLSARVSVTVLCRMPGVYRLRAEMPRLPGEPRKQHTRTVHCSARELAGHREAYRLEKQLEANRMLEAAGLLSPVTVRLPALSLEWYALDWLRQRTKDGIYSPNTLSQYRNLIVAHVIPTWGDIPLTLLSRADIRDGFHRLAISGLSALTLRHIRSRLAALIEAAEAERIPMQRGLLRRLPMPLPISERRSTLTEGEVQRLLDKLEGHRLGPVVRCMLYTGITRGEACALIWRDVDTDKGTISVTRAATQVDNGAVRVVSTRTPRVVRPPRFGVDAFRLMRTRAEEMAAWAGHDVDLQPVFLSSAGEAWRPSQLTQAIATLRRQLGLPALTTHALRRMQASRLPRLQRSVQASLRRLGEADAATTLRHVVAQLRPNPVRGPKDHEDGDA